MQFAPKIPVGLLGVSGYTGMELARLLATHPALELVCATSRQEAGKTIEDIYPFLRGFPLASLVITAPDAAEIAAKCRLVFMAVPHGVAMEMAPALLAEGLRVVDLSADFRLDDPAVFEAWYASAHAAPDLLTNAVYGLVELNPCAISTASLVANPGCYPTASILALAAPLALGLIHTDDIVIDAKSGVTGAGRKASQTFLYSEVTDSFKPYSLGKHRHTPEIEQEVSRIAGKPITLSFNPHLVPMNRGILATVYTRLKEHIKPEQLHALVKGFWADNALQTEGFQCALSAASASMGSAGWVRVLPYGDLPQTRFVRGSMFCDIGLTLDPRTGRLIITSAIDNLCRGASGQAVANANLMLGLPVATGLNMAPVVP